MTHLIEVRVSNLVGAALDWAVAQVEGISTIMLSPRKEEPPKPFALFGSLALSVGGDDQSSYTPSSCWHCGGPLIDKYKGSAHHNRHLEEEACRYSAGPEGAGIWLYGPTALVAFCRTLVLTKLGDTVQVPKELCP
ncbi:phage protein NinX family protein [Pseudomonas putida]|uniref:phage protein NinX family protein n=2 Tax=Pseudomonas TaxID=286 RepID=UPI0015E1A58F|nr:phage protein NinX family protein [Pseudomonas putida]